jgi:hypothetical protein
MAHSLPLPRLVGVNPEVSLSWYFLVTQKLSIEYPAAVRLAVLFMTQARRI